MIELHGRIERVTFVNEENGYTVAKVSIEGGEEATVVGVLHDPSPGVMLTMRGEWTVHPRFGQQFKLQEYETVAPRTAEAIERYLGGGSLKGVGPVTARQIVGTFGTKTLEVMDGKIGRLREVPGIGRKRLEQIRRSWEDQRGAREVMLFLQGSGVSAAYAARIHRRYGARAASIVRKNPYRLAADIPGIGFATADRIAGEIGYPRDGAGRAEAGLLYLLDRCTDEGHLYLPAGELVRRGAELLEIGPARLEAVLARLEEGRRVVVDRPDGGPAGGGGEDPSGAPVYQPRLFACETAVARTLRALAGSPVREPERETLARRLGRLSQALGEEQQRAVRAAAENGVVVITGGPGTGKTTIIDVLARGLMQAGMRLQLAAPTGRAAKRMTEATHREARTIHRLLEVDPTRGGFRRNAANPLDCDALIVDEISMVDVPLMAALLDALRPESRLIMIGDADQLPSVGPGNLLADVIASGVVPVQRLTRVYRQESGSRIVAGAYDIIRGRIPAFSEGIAGDFYFINQPDAERAVETVDALVRERIPARFGFDPMEEIQVLTPMHRGPAGATNLNALLQDALNPGGGEIERGSRSLRPGDKVMQTRNNYELDVFNGDIGRVRRIDPESSAVTVAFDSRVVRYPVDNLDELALAYAITVHKAQGSEFPAVVLPLLTQHYLLLQRNLLYTAVTRGKRLVVIVGSRKALAAAVGNDRTQHRYTALARRLAGGARSSPSRTKLTRP